MDLYGTHFEFGGISSRTYGLILANVETERLTSLSGGITENTIYSKSEKKKYYINDDYSDSPLSFDIDIVTDDDRIIETNERREIEKWLFNKPKYQKLYLDLADDIHGETYEFIDGIQKRLYLNCRFMEPQKLEYNGGIVGYRCVVKCDSPMAWQDTVIKTYNLANNSVNSRSTITVDVDTDINDYTYPKVTMVMGGAGGNITLINNTDDTSRLTRFTGLTPGITFNMAGDLNYISGQNYTKFVKQNFIRLLDGQNQISVLGNVTSITFEFQNRRYL